MYSYIRKLRSKSEQSRKQIFALTMIGSMAFVVFIWIYGLNAKFSSPKVKDQVSQDIKPFKLFANSLSNTYENISANVIKAPSVNTNTTDELSNKPEKQIQLIQVENSNQ